MREESRRSSGIGARLFYLVALVNLISDESLRLSVGG